MRIRGRTIRPSTLAERRLMLSFGVQHIRVPRGTNPFVVSRRFARAARCETPDHLFVRDIISRSCDWPEPKPSPETDTTEPVGDESAESRATS